MIIDDLPPSRIHFSVFTLLMAWIATNSSIAEDEYFDYEREHWAFVLLKDWPVPAFESQAILESYGVGKAVKSPYHFRDIHTTILHLLGLDQDQLTYRHLGRDEWLPEIQGEVVCCTSALLG
jgi:hypothetical protein